jgi:hypothetical protein
MIPGNCPPMERTMDTRTLVEAVEIRDIDLFLTAVLPPSWAGVRARILESGVVFADRDGRVPWAPRWSAIPWTVKRGEDRTEAALKSVMYRVHDALHQLWGLPHPRRFDTDDRFFYKRVQMCGEVAVLTLTEFVYAEWLWASVPELRPFLERRNALPMLHGPLAGRTTQQIAARLDGIVHRNLFPKWVRDHDSSRAFVNDYAPMLEDDRRMADWNWALIERIQWRPDGAPQSLAPEDLDGLELTLWMVADFERCLQTTPLVDEALRNFNRERRGRVVLPEGWRS